MDEFRVGEHDILYGIEQGVNERRRLARTRVSRATRSDRAFAFSMLPIFASPRVDGGSQQQVVSETTAATPAWWALRKHGSGFR
jgi:hypothetical protein